MVKNEVDVVALWVHHHASLVGYHNVHVIDNNSTDGTYEVLHALSQTYGVRLSRECKWKNKGVYISTLMRRHVNESDLFIPMDIDEFLAVSHEHEQHISVSHVCSYIDALPLRAGIYKMHYVVPAIEVDGGYAQAPIEASRARWQSGRPYGKTFLSTSAPARIAASRARSSRMHWQQIPGSPWELPMLDEGFHMREYESMALFVRLCLVHYHTRNVEQLKRKTIAGWIGKGHKFDLSDGYLTKLRAFEGRHYRKTILDMLHGKPVRVPVDLDPRTHNISLAPLQAHLRTLIEE